MKQHDAGTGQGREAGAGFDTPSLIELWRMAPYLHDGRAATLRDLFAPDLPPPHGHDLIAFLLSR